ncbi:uncharacterized protein LOC143914011 [Arctopsyche grandis]|uniref:uncharacterized protein LOC143914011 n=1 Tax=Arctopsyche grandis TaxID=121162 RepID=UPI00406D69CD
MLCCCGIFSNVSMTMTTTRFLHGSPVSVSDVCDFVGILMCWSLLTRWRRCLSGCAGEIVSTAGLVLHAGPSLVLYQVAYFGRAALVVKVCDGLDGAVVQAAVFCVESFA